MAGDSLNVRRNSYLASLINHKIKNHTKLTEEAKNTVGIHLEELKRASTKRQEPTLKSPKYN